MSKLESFAQREATEVFSEPGPWIAAWQQLRANDACTLLLDRYGNNVTAYLLGPQDTFHRLIWDIESIDLASDTFWRPSQHGIEETTYSEILMTHDTILNSEPPHHPTIRGKGVFMYPLGPVHADVAESLEYQLTVMGDEIIRLHLKNGFKHRHIRDLVVGQSITDALPLVERFTTTSNVHHTLAFSMAVEEAYAMAIPEEVSLTRQLLAELERSASHLGDLALLAVSTGLTVPQMEYLHLKETLLRINYHLVGHRYLRGTICPGGLDTRLWSSSVNPRQADETITNILDASDGIRHDLERTTSFLDRLHNTGTIPKDTIRKCPPVGPVGRASGLPFDVRTHLPYGLYNRMTMDTPLYTSGDTYARFSVRVDELHESLNLVRRILGGWHPEAIRQSRPTLPTVEGRPVHEEGMGVVEAPRGLLVYRVILDNTGKIRHLGVATPSQRNWGVVPSTVENNNILQDFPIIDASFSLSVSGWDG